MAENKKSSVCKKVYVDANGEETRSVTPDTVELQFRFENGNTHKRKPSDYPKEIEHCLAFFGVSEKDGNAYAGSKGDPDVAEELFLSMDEQLMGGTWVEKAEAGPRPSLIADAIIAALVSAGQKVDDTRATAIREKVKDKDTREGALKDPVIKAEYEAIKAKRAAERAKDAAKKAKGVEVTVAGF